MKDFLLFFFLEKSVKGWVAGGGGVWSGEE